MTWVDKETSFRLYEAVKRCSRVLFATPRPDADSIGCMVAFKSFLERQARSSRRFVQCEFFSPEPIPPALRSMLRNLVPFSIHISSVLPKGVAPDCVIGLDYGDLRLCGTELTDLVIEHCPLLVGIDHHQQSHLMPHDGERVSIEIPNAPSTSALVLEFFEQIGFLSGRGLDPYIADILLAGLLADTGNFSHDFVTPEAIHIAARMVEQGASFSRVRDAQNMMRAARNTNIMKLFKPEPELDREAGLFYWLFEQTELDRLGISTDDIRPLLHPFRYLPGVNLIALIVRQPPMGPIQEYFYVSLRSAPQSDVNAHEIAQRLGGGGGHKGAASYTSLQNAAKILEELKNALTHSVSGASV